MRIVELPEADVSKRQTPNKEIVGQIKQTFNWISCIYMSMGGDAVYSSS